MQSSWSGPRQFMIHAPAIQEEFFHGRPGHVSMTGPGDMRGRTRLADQDLQNLVQGTDGA